MKVLEAIERHGLMQSGDRVAVAVSGGCDSMAGLHFLHANRERLGIAVLCVNVEHGIRGESSRADTAFVREFCQTSGIPFLGYAVDAPARAREKRETLEQAARAARYGVFNEVLVKGLADCVAVCHNREDNAETVLMHLFRGAGLRGASGMRHRTGGIVRPLLDTGREEILAYLAENGVPFREDESNADARYTRNFLRREVLPLLRARYPGLTDSLLRFAAAAAEDDAQLEALALPLLTRTKDGYALEVAEAARPALFKRALGEACRIVNGGQDVAAVHLAAALRLASKGKSGGELFFPGGIRVYRDYGRLTVAKAEPEKAEGAELPFRSGVLCLGRYALKAERVAHARPRPGVLSAADVGALQSAVWRTPRGGDMFRPFGSGGRKTLAKYLSDKKVPARAREALPVLACGAEILLVAGVEISESLRVTAGEPAWEITMEKE